MEKVSLVLFLLHSANAHLYVAGQGMRNHSGAGILALAAGQKNRSLAGKIVTGSFDLFPI